LIDRSGREHPPVPISSSYWVLADRLLAGEYAGAPTREETLVKLAAFLEAGIDVFIDLTEEDVEGLRPYAADLFVLAQDADQHVTHRRMPIPDFSVPPRRTMTSILDVIDESLAEGKRVYVHCWGGIGRTGTVVGCYLARHGLAPRRGLLGAIQAFREKTPDAARPSPETEPQRALVLSWRPGE
jgi:hypothetical protein